MKQTIIDRNITIWIKCPYCKKDWTTEEDSRFEGSKEDYECPWCHKILILDLTK